MRKNKADNTAYMKKYRQSKSFKKWYAANADKERERSRVKHYKQKYGISWEDKVCMYEEQKGLCACCFKPMPPVRDTRVCVDHDHCTKKVRALVHRDCNWMIGWIENYPELVDLAREYLKKFST